MENLPGRLKGEVNVRQWSEPPNVEYFKCSELLCVHAVLKDALFSVLTKPLSQVSLASAEYINRLWFIVLV